MSDLPNPVDRREDVRVSEQGAMEYRERVVSDAGAQRRMDLVRVNRFIWLLFGALDAGIGLRVLLKLMAANPANPFAAFVYGITDLFLWPFTGLTVTPSAQGMVLEIPAIIAMLVYALVAWMLDRLFWVLFDRSSARSVTTYTREGHL